MEDGCVVQMLWWHVEIWCVRWCGLESCLGGGLDSLVGFVGGIGRIL